MWKMCPTFSMWASAFVCVVSAHTGLVCKKASESNAIREWERGSGVTSKFDRGFKEVRAKPIYHGATRIREFH